MLVLGGVEGGVGVVDVLPPPPVTLLAGPWVAVVVPVGGVVVPAVPLAPVDCVVGVWVIAEVAPVLTDGGVYVGVEGGVELVMPVEPVL